MAAISRVFRLLLCAAMVIAAAAAIRGFTWFIFAICHDLVASRYGWHLLLLG